MQKEQKNKLWALFFELYSMMSEVLYSKHIHDFRTQSKYKTSFTIEQSSKNSAHSLFFFRSFCIF